MPRIRALSREFIKARLNQGTSQGAAREAHNALADLSPSEIARRWGPKWVGLSGAPHVTASESHQIEKSRSHHQRNEGRDKRVERLLNNEADREKAARLRLPEPLGDRQDAHDAGVLYRATREEVYRERFEEGSP